MPCPDPDQEHVQLVASAPVRNFAASSAPAAETAPVPNAKTGNELQQEQAQQLRAERQRRAATDLQACSRCYSPLYKAQLAQARAQTEPLAQDQVPAHGIDASASLLDAPPQQPCSDKPVLRIGLDRFCTYCALRHLHNRSTRAGWASVKAACLLRSKYQLWAEQQQQHGNPASCADASGDRLLLALSGGAHSSVLLQLSTILFGIDTEGRGTAADRRLAEQQSAAGTASAVKKKGDGRRGGSLRRTVIRTVDVLHVDDSLLFCSADAGADSAELDWVRAERRKRMQAMVDRANEDVGTASGAAGAPSEARYRLVVVNLEDVFDDDAALAETIAGRGSSEGSAGSFWRCEVVHDPTTNLYADSAPTQARSGPSKAELLRQLFRTVCPTETAAASAETLRTTLTRAEDLHRVLVNVLLRRIALLGGPSSLAPQQGVALPRYSALLFGTSATRRAIRFMDALSKGEGSKVAIDHSPAAWLGLPDSDDSARADPFKRVLVLRPLSDCGSKELAWFAKVQELDYLMPRDLAESPLLADLMAKAGSGAGSSKASLERLTEGFVLELERGLSSTVSTIDKTGRKIMLRDPQESGGAGAISQGKHFHYLQKELYAGVVTRQEQKFVDEICGLACFPPLPEEAARATAQPPMCPLCGLPSQAQDARAWKSRISIRSLQARAETVGVAPESSKVDLSALLCYACSLVLDVPVDAGGRDQGITLSLPGYCYSSCFENASQLLKTGSSTSPGGPAEQSERATPSTAPAAAPPRLRRLDRDELRSQVHSFLLEDGAGQ